MQTRKNKNKIDAIYYINMNKSKDRYALMQKVLKDEVFDSMKKYRIPGVDGMRKDVIPYLHSKLKNINLQKYPPNIYCCLLSHLNTLLEFSKSDHDIALIVEDDLSLDYKKYWKEDLSACIKNAPKDWGILQLAFIRDKNLPTKLYSFWKNSGSTCAYLVNKKVIQSFIKDNFINNQFILYNNIQHESDFYIYTKIKTYTYKYPFFTYTGEDSTLHPSHVDKIHIPYKQKIEKLLQQRMKSKTQKRYHKT
jgi:GR25 family glycosyltransferase involved in LPS biosynthesis